MPIEIKETFQVRAPIDEVWRFIMDPARVVTCMPGASLDSVVDEKTFHGTVKVKVGAITTQYKGRVQFTAVDEQAHSVEMLAEGRETGGGLAKGTMRSGLRSLPDGQTGMVVEANVDLTGRIMQVGRGMIQGVAQQLFLQFVSQVQQRLETGQATGSVAGGSPPPAPAEAPPIRIVPLVMSVMWAAIARFFRRLLGRLE